MTRVAKVFRTPRRLGRRATKVALALGVMLGASLYGGDVPHAQAKGQDDEAKRLMSEASVCRKLGIAGDFDPAIMDAACARLKEASKLASGRLEASAEAAYAQCLEFSEERSGTLARFMPLVAALDDPLSPRRSLNGFAQGSALSKAIDSIGPKISVAGHKQLPFVVRCQSSEPKLCDDMADNLALDLKGTGLFAIDAASLVTFGLTDERLGRPGAQPDATYAKALYERKGWPLAIIVDVSRRDVVDCTVPTAYASISAKKWDLKTGLVSPLVSGSGLAIDGLDRKWSWVLLFALAALLSFALGLIRARQRNPLFRIEKPDGTADLDGTMRQAGLIGLACAAVTLASAVAFPLSALPLVEGLGGGVDAGLRDANGNFLVNALIYPVALGALLYLGPALFALIGEAAAQAQIEKLSMLGLKKVEWVELVPSLQLGAVAGLGQTLLLTMGSVAYPWIAVMALPPWILTALSVSALKRIHDTKSRPPLAVAAMALLLYFPLLALMSSLGLALVLGLSLVASGLVFVLSRTLSATEESKVDATEAEETRSLGAEKGSIVFPEYLNEGPRELDALTSLCHQEERKVQELWIVGQSGAGKTRSVDELLQSLRALDGDASPLLIGRAAGERVEASDEVERTFGFASDLLSGVFPLDARFEMLERQQETREKALEAAQALSGFAVPGVGLLLGFAEGDPPPGLTTNWLAEDVAESLIERAKESRVVLFLDDLDQADTESIELLARIRDRLKLRQHLVEHPIYVVVTTHSAPAELAANAQGSDPRSVAFASLFSGYPSGKATHLSGLDPAAAMRLTLNTGIAASEESVGWLSEQAQAGPNTLPLPGAILALLGHLETVGLIEANDKGERCLASRATLDRDKASIPKDIIGMQTERLKALDPDDCFILQMAAECGRRFTARTLAAGLERKPLLVLRALHRIERDTGFVHDDEQEDVFQFASESVRRALHAMTRRRLADAHCGDEDAEIMRVFHYQMAKALSHDPQCAPEVLLRHASRAGVRMAEEAMSAAMKAAESARKLMAFRRMKEFVDIARSHARLFKASPEQIAHLDFLEAYASKNLGGQDNRDRAFSLFNALLQSATPGPETYPEFEALQAMLEGLYEEKQLDEQKVILDWQWPEGYTPRDPLSPLVLRFYRVIAQADVDRAMRQAPTYDLVEELGALLTQSKALKVETEVARRHRDLFISRLLQNLAQVHSFVRDIPPEERLEMLQPWWTESLALKREHGDLQGQALTLGTQGNFFSFVLNRYPEALALYEEDLALIEKMGDDSQLSSILNRIATVHFAMAQGAEGEAQQEGFERALDLSKQALKWGVDLDREGDLAFAAEAVMKFAAQLGRSEDFAQALQAASDRSIWERFGNLKMMIEKYAALSEAASQLNQSEGLQAVLDLIQGVSDARGAAAG